MLTSHMEDMPWTSCTTLLTVCVTTGAVPMSPKWTFLRFNNQKYGNLSLPAPHISHKHTYSINRSHGTKGTTQKEYAGDLTKDSSPPALGQLNSTCSNTSVGSLTLKDYSFKAFLQVPLNSQDGRFRNGFTANRNLLNSNPPGDKAMCC